MSKNPGELPVLDFNPYPHNRISDAMAVAKIVGITILVAAVTAVLALACPA